jgi:RHS repeat-associated protein
LVSKQISQASNGGTPTRYVLDQAAGLVQVLSDGTYTYLYGNDRLAQQSTTSREYFLTDAMGSVRQMVNGSGVITLAESYQPYGSVLTMAGSGASPYGFDGEWTEPTSLQYLRARYYSNSTGRFIGKDTWQGDLTKPISYNLWLYAYSNPVIYTDPTGNNPGLVAALIPALVGLGASIGVGAAAGLTFGYCTYELALSGKCGCDIQAQAMSMSRWEYAGMNALAGGLIGGTAFIMASMATVMPAAAIIVGVYGLVISVSDLEKTVNIIKNEVGWNECTITRVMVDLLGIVFSTIGIVNGVKAWRASGSGLAYAELYPAITPPEDRGGLRRAMGDPPPGMVNAQAHHDCPWKFRAWFAQSPRGMNVNDPQYGRWVGGAANGPHQNWSLIFEQEWGNFIAQHPNATRALTINFLTQLRESGRFPAQ